MSKKLYCIAEFAPKAGREQELFELLMSLEPLTLREDGCVRYRVTRQVKHQQAPTLSKFSIVFNEEWASVEAFEEHCKQPYIAGFFKKYVETPETALTDDCNVRVFSDQI